MKHLPILLILFSFSCMSQSGAYKNFSELNFEKVVLYSFNRENDFDFVAHDMLGLIPYLIKVNI